MGRAFGEVTTTATTEVPVNSTVYTEQSDAVVRSLVSSSASDAAAGTGARTVKITYYTYVSATGAIDGPKAETVTLNGTTAVDTTAADITLIEKMEVMTAGSGGVAAGTISLKAAAAGAGATVASIATGAVQTFLAHHYVSNGEKCRIRGMSAMGGDEDTSASLRLKALPYPSGVEKVITERLIVTGVAWQAMTLDIDVRGPARVRLMTAPGDTDSQITQGGFDFSDVLGA